MICQYVSLQTVTPRLLSGSFAAMARCQAGAQLLGSFAAARPGAAGIPLVIWHSCIAIWNIAQLHGSIWMMCDDLI